MSGTKVRDDEQNYHLAQAHVYPCGSAMEVYSTPENQRMVLKHVSGSHIEFKADGSIVMKAMKDFHWHTGSVSGEVQKATGSVQGAETSSYRQDTDYEMDITGKFMIKCDSFEVEAKNVAYINAGTDCKIEANNIIEKAKEQVSMEATKSIYMDAKEKGERFTRTRSEIGTEEGGGGLDPGDAVGGLNVIHVQGNTVIENDDPNGGITLSSAGYLNFVCGQERVDITGKWAPSISGFKPSSVASPGKATFSSMIFRPQEPGKDNKASPGGTFSQFTEGGSYYKDATVGPTHSLSSGFGYHHSVETGHFMQEVMEGNRLRDVAGDETVEIQGIQRIQAQEIYLN